MADVVDFPVRDRGDAGDRVWVCACGCSTWTLRCDGQSECASCEKISTVEGGGWSDHLAGGGDVDADLEVFEDVQGNGCADFARASAGRTARRDDRALIVSAGYDGGLSVWGDISTAEERDWALERLAQARALVEGML